MKTFYLIQQFDDFDEIIDCSLSARILINEKQTMSDKYPLAKLKVVSYHDYEPLPF